LGCFLLLFLLLPLALMLLLMCHLLLSLQSRYLVLGLGFQLLGIGQLGPILTSWPVARNRGELLQRINSLQLGFLQQQFLA